MKIEDLIPVEQLCTHYKVERTFFDGLEEYGLIEITTIERSNCLHIDDIHRLEKMLRLHNELNLNYEGIDTVMNLLSRIDDLHEELRQTKRRLNIYEGGN